MSTLHNDHSEEIEHLWHNQNEPLGDLDKELIYDPAEYPTIKDVIVFGPVLLNRRAWTIGMKGYRWSHLKKTPDEILNPKTATEFVQERSRDLRNYSGFLENSLIEQAAKPTPMDVDILVPTLLVVVSPTPFLTFSDVPISAKVEFEMDEDAEGKPIKGTKKVVIRKLDTNRSARPPKFWKFGDKNPLWQEPDRHLLTWFSNYDHTKNLPSLATHNYHMKFRSVSIDSSGKQYNEGMELPIIFDPGNNNGGAGKKP